MGRSGQLLTSARRGHFEGRTTERKARRAAATLPLGAAIVVSAVISGGFPDGKSFAAAVAIGFVLSQVIFALWLNARHSATSARADSGG